jgi:hypothetical protein
MPEVTAQKILNSDVDDFVAKFHGRRIKVHCADGAIFIGTVDWFDEGEEFGIGFEDVIDQHGVAISGYNVPFSYIDSFIPLEGENSDEDIKRLFGD